MDPEGSQGQSLLWPFFIGKLKRKMKFSKYLLEKKEIYHNKKWRHKNFKGELYDKSGKWIGNIFWEKGESDAYVIDIEYGIVKKLVGKYDPTKFKQTGKLDVSAGKSVDKWTL